ncbi:hypothetical protein DFH29DRAFT_882658 [Suillus ampliporus]|nr:hypothetical protein DFH29DRAFT_882658 [Suillus ampliporus]
MCLAITSTSPPWNRAFNHIPSYGPGRQFYINHPWAWLSNSIPSYGPNRRSDITTLGPVIKLYTIYGPGRQFYIPKLGLVIKLYTIYGPDRQSYITTLGPVVNFYTIIHQILYHLMGLTINPSSPPWVQSSTSTPSYGPSRQFYTTTPGPVVEFYTTIWAQPSLLHHFGHPILDTS